MGEEQEGEDTSLGEAPVLICLLEVSVPILTCWVLLMGKLVIHRQTEELVDFREQGVGMVVLKAEKKSTNRIWWTLSAWSRKLSHIFASFIDL